MNWSYIFAVTARDVLILIMGASCIIFPMGLPFILIVVGCVLGAKAIEALLDIKILVGGRDAVGVRRLPGGDR